MNHKQSTIIRIKEKSFEKAFYRLLKNRGRVKVTGIGIFQVKKMKARKNQISLTGERVDRPAYKKITFRATKALKDLVQ